ncbi:hypothetical protein WJX79_005200 [Trebouxia sp. C0005]
MYRFVAVRHELPCMVRTNTDSNSDSPAGYLRTATAHTVPFYTKETAVSEPSSAEARPTMLHLVAAEWGTSVESLQVKVLWPEHVVPEQSVCSHSEAVWPRVASGHLAGQTCTRLPNYPQQHIRCVGSVIRP